MRLNYGVVVMLNERVNNYITTAQALFVSASHQTGLDTRSMTRRPIIMGIRRGEGQAPAEARALQDNTNHRPT